jgi:hypothetical protein
VNSIASVLTVNSIAGVLTVNSIARVLRVISNVKLRCQKVKQLARNRIRWRRLVEALCP